MRVSIIVAASENYAIGKNNSLLWSLPKDMKFFKSTTSFHCVVMGRLTYESLGKPLPNRTNIVVSRQENANFEGCLVVKSIEEALVQAKSNQESETFIIGGGKIYASSMPLVDRIYITKVHAKFEADTFFPEISTKDWKCISSEPQIKDEKHAYNFDFEVWERN